MGNFEYIQTETDRGVRWITLNRPEKLNAGNDGLFIELNEAFVDFDADEDAQVAILRGAGRAFCAGADVVQRQLRPMEEIRRHGRPSARNARPDFYHDQVNWKPIITAVHGYAIGAGLGLAMGADIVVAAEGTKFQNRETQRGLGGISHWATLKYWSGDRFANDVSLTGRMFTAEEALEHGLVNYVVPQADLYPKAEELARLIVENPPLSVRATVRPARWFASEMLREASYYGQGRYLHLTEDFRESASAFVEKRPAVYKGR